MALKLLSLPAIFLWCGCSYADEPVSSLHIRAVEHHLLPPVISGTASMTGSELATRMHDLNVPGVSIAVIHRGQLAWARGYGVTRLGGDDITPQTLFAACSLSKPVSAMAFLTLVQQGKVQLDTDINGYLTSWKLPENKFTQDSPVTLRELLNHTAGVTISGFPGYTADAALPTLAQMLEGQPPANTRPIRVDMKPGIGFRYSGGGYLRIPAKMNADSRSS